MTNREANLIKQIKNEASALRARTKKDLATMYCRACLGPVSNAKDVMKDLNKAQMVYDICKANHGKRLAEVALL